MWQRVAFNPHLPSWQKELSGCITDPQELLRLLELPPLLSCAAQAAARSFPLRVPRSFVARMERGNPRDPLLLQVLPLALEQDLTPGFHVDPVGDLPARTETGLLHKYAGRILAVTTGACAVHCRYCFRRHFPYSEHSLSRGAWDEALEHIRRDTSLNEVILSGGDPLTLSDAKLTELVQSLATIAHVQRVRVHSRLPVVLPSRITHTLVTALTATRLIPIMVIHANHAQELDHTVQTALTLLRENHITLLNQSVLLRGINDNAEALTALSERLFVCGVMPYYLHALDRVSGAAHFDVGDDHMHAIYQQLQARLPGYLVPKLVRELAGSASKTPITAPQTLTSSNVLNLT